MTYGEVVGLLIGIAALGPGLVAAGLELAHRYQQRRAALRRARPLRRIA